MLIMRTLILGALLALLAAPLAALEIDNRPLEELRWVARPIVIFAPSPQDPRLARQLARLEEREADLRERDVVVLVDTADGEATALRERLRPRDFNVVVLSKEGEVIYRKPDAVTAREVIRLIDRLPLRREEIESQRESEPTTRERLELRPSPAPES